MKTRLSDHHGKTVEGQKKDRQIDDFSALYSRPQVIILLVKLHIKGAVCHYVLIALKPSTIYEEIKLSEEYVQHD